METILSEGTKRGFSINHLLLKLVVNPAKIFGLYPKKGSIQIGADADFVIYKNKPYEITEGNRHSNCDYTSYEGFQSEFSLDKVIQRGNLIIDEGNLLAKAGSGEFQKRK